MNRRLDTNRHSQPSNSNRSMLQQYTSHPYFPSPAFRQSYVQSPRLKPNKASIFLNDRMVARHKVKSKILDLSKQISSIVRSSQEKEHIKTPDKWVSKITPSTSCNLDNK